MSLFSLLAESAKTKRRTGGRDGDFYAAGQAGVAYIHKLIRTMKGEVTKNVIIVSEVIEAHAKTADCKVQTPGTMVKKIYPLLKREWEIDKLANDLCDIAGVDTKTMSAEDIESMFKEAFDGGALLGVAHTFDTSEKTREGKHPLTNIYFGEVSSAPGALNDPAQVEKRKAALAVKK